MGRPKTHNALVNAWMRAEKKVTELSDKLDAANDERMDRLAELGKAVVPEDAKPDEKFMVCCENGGVLALHKTDDGIYEAEWRTPPTCAEKAPRKKKPA